MTFFYYAFQRHVNTLYTREFVFASSFLITLTFSAPIRSFARVDLHFSLSYSFWFVLLSCVWPGSEKKLFNVRTYKIIPASLFRVSVVVCAVIPSPLWYSLQKQKTSEKQQQKLQQ